MKKLHLSQGCHFLTLFLILSLLCINVHAQTAMPPQLGKNPIAEVIKAMTLEEKSKLVVGNGFSMPGQRNNAPVVGNTDKKVPGAAGTTYPIPRLGIPSIVVSDGPAGVRIDSVRKENPGKTYYATAWPIGTLLASSWDTSLVKKVGQAFGTEVHEYGIDVLLAPALNIHRNPLGGRNFEYYSEDPLVAGKITAAIVNGVESDGVGTSIKHFAANNQETDRNTVNTIVSERALREIYLKGFEIAVKQAQPWTVMSSYNLINDTYTSENYDLLTTILRKEWGFKGLVMTDWFGGKDPVAQMKAGNDLLMPGTAQQSTAIMEAVKNGTLDEKVLDENVARVLNLVLQSPTFKKYKYSDQPNLKEHAAISRMAAAEGMILLKNDGGSLPVSSMKKVAVFGNYAYDLIAGGTGSGDVNKSYTTNLLKGLTNAGLTVDKELADSYTTYLTEEKIKHPKKNFFQEFMNPTPPPAEYFASTDKIAQKASANDFAVITIGRNSGEGRDRKVENDFNLSDTERTVMKNVVDAFHALNKKVIVVLNIGGVIETTSWSALPDAILLAWQPGLEGGNAIADVLTGKVNPSGKLATTFPVNYNDVPSAKNFPGKEFPEKATTGNFGRKVVPAEVVYEEGIYVGYRYFNTFGVKPAYEFGYGLSYTTFNYGNLKLSSATFTNKITASVTIKNTGKKAGKEVVELYLSAPTGKLDKPASELKGFAKTKLLQPGQSETVSFVITPSDLASFNTDASEWIADAGKYEVKIGASSLDVKQSASFNLPKDLIVEKTNKVLAPKVSINELKTDKKGF
jgi:beta-glucosidase